MRPINNVVNNSSRCRVIQCMDLDQLNSDTVFIDIYRHTTFIKPKTLAPSFSRAQLARDMHIQCYNIIIAALLILM